MCGIVGVFDLSEDPQQMRGKVLKMAKKSGIEGLIGLEFIATIKLF